MAAAAKSIAKIRKKKWVEIFAPKYMNSVFLGDSYVYDTQSLMGRKIKVNLLTITNDIKKQNINATFQINNIAGEKAYTAFVGYELIPSAIRRMIRRGKNRVDYTMYLMTKDDVPLKCNILLVTANMTKKSLLTAMRAAAHRHLVKAASNSAFSDFAIDIINHKTQEGMRKGLSKIYPIKSCEIRTLDVTKKHLSHDEKVKMIEREKLAKEREAAEQSQADEEAAKQKEEPQAQEMEPEQQEEAAKQQEEPAEEKPKKARKKKEAEEPPAE